MIGGRLAGTDPRRLALRHAGLYGGAVLAGLAAVFGFLGLVAIVDTVGGLAVRFLLDRRPESTDRAPAA